MPPLGYRTTRTPPADDDSTKIATTEWVKDRAITRRWEPVTNGDSDDPELIFNDGDVVMAEVDE